MPEIVIAAAIILVIALAILYLSVRIVGPDDRMVVFRLGRTHAGLVREPGVRFLIPLVDRPVMVDLRERRATLAGIEAVSRDNVPILADAVIAWRVVNPLRSVVNVAYLPGALQGVATTTLRALIGDVVAADLPSHHEQLSDMFLAKLGEIGRRWGAAVTEARVVGVERPSAPS